VSFPGVRNKWGWNGKKQEGFHWLVKAKNIGIGDILHLAVCLFHPTVSTWSVHYPHLLLRCLGDGQEFLFLFLF
jgi:hypothetical protein